MSGSSGGSSGGAGGGGNSLGQSLAKGPVTLLKASPGKTGDFIKWEIEVRRDAQSDSASIVTRHGKVGGAIVEDEPRVVTEGKNVGKSNETSVFEQALKEATAKLKLKLRAGYYSPENLPAAPSLEASHDQLPLLPSPGSPAGVVGTTIPPAKVAGEPAPPLLPMLAVDFHLKKQRIVYPAFAQRKLDGVRCLATWSSDQVVLFSRRGLRFQTVPHVTAALAQVLPKDLVLDGELYVHGVRFETLAGALRRLPSVPPPPKRKKGQAAEGGRRAKNSEQLSAVEGEQRSLSLATAVKFEVFDAFVPLRPSLPFRERYQLAQDVVARAQGHVNASSSLSPLSLVINDVVHNESDVLALHNKYVADGYEGIIVRNSESVYRPDVRSTDLQKFKNFKDDEFEIVGFAEGSGSDANTVIWTCITPSGSTFSVRPRGSTEERAALLAHAHGTVGKKLTVRYQDIGVSGIPRFPVGLAVRDYE